jgi:hypothetical protein
VVLIDSNFNYSVSTYDDGYLLYLHYIPVLATFGRLTLDYRESYVLPPRTRNTRGNEVTNKNISGNLVSNCSTVVPFNKALSRIMIHVFL